MGLEEQHHLGLGASSLRREALSRVNRDGEARNRMNHFLIWVTFDVSRSVDCEVPRPGKSEGKTTTMISGIQPFVSTDVGSTGVFLVGPSICCKGLGEV